MFTLSLDSQVSEASLVKLRNEVEETLGREDDPLIILIKREEESTGECSFPQCYIPCKGCTKR